MASLRLGVGSPDLAAGRRLESVLGTRTDAKIVLHVAEETQEAPAHPNGDRPDGLEALAAGDVDLALCPVETLVARADRRFEILAVPERGNPASVVLGQQPLWGLAAGSEVAVLDSLTEGYSRALYPELRPVRMGLEELLDGIDQGRLSSAVCPFQSVRGTDKERLIAELLPVNEWIPPAGRAALALIGRAGDRTPGQIPERGLHADLTDAVEAELTFRTRLSVDPEVGVGVLGMTYPGGFRLKAAVVSSDGTRALVHEVSGLGRKGPEVGRLLLQEVESRGRGVFPGLRASELP